MVALVRRGQTDLKGSLIGSLDPRQQLVEIGRQFIGGSAFCVTFEERREPD